MRGNWPTGLEIFISTVLRKTRPELSEGISERVSSSQFNAFEAKRNSPTLSINLIATDIFTNMEKLYPKNKSAEQSSEAHEKIDTNREHGQNEASSSDSKKRTWISAGFASIAIPAYCYFFGYSSFKYRLEGTGFDSPEISTTPGDVYFHAFSAFAFLGAKALPASKELLIKHFNENWLLVGCISVVAVLLSYLFQLFVHKKNSFFKWMEKIDNKIPTSRLPRYSKKLTSLFKRTLFWSYQLFTGKGPTHLIWIGKSLLLGAVIYLGYFIVLPLILGIMLFGAMLLIPPPALGEKMAAEEMQSFNCPNNVSEISNHMACTVVKLKDNRVYIGIVENRDPKFLYLLTKDEAKTIPIEQIAETGRHVFTGKNKSSFSLDKPYQGESLYCHQSAAPFTASSLLDHN